MLEALLRTKLFVPPLRPALVPRPHLIERLNQALELGHKLTLVSAPAGSGKTTLIVNWLSQRARPFAWFSIDKDDSDIVQFFTYVAASIQKIGEVGNELQVLLQSPKPASIKSLVIALINDCTTISFPFILVLDDFHLISGTAVPEAFAILLDNMPHQLHLVITSRADPLLPLSRLRARGQLMELRTDDLRFSPKEAADFMQTVMGLSLPVEAINALESRTEGWIAGLQMAALSIQGLNSENEIAAFIRDFAGSHRYIFDYLTDEVLQKQLSAIQEFLLKTSILDQLSASLCDAVAGIENSQRVLNELDNSNMFIMPLDSQRQWYRYHHLFVDLLQHRLAQRPKHERDKLHRRAAQWFETNHMIDQAIMHYREADDQQNIIRLIKQHGSDHLQPGQLYHLQSWLDALLPEQVQSDSWLAMFQAWICYFEQKTEKVAIWVEHGLHDLENLDDHPQDGAAKLRGSLEGLRSWLAIQQGDFKQAAQLAEQALAILPETDPVWRGIVYIFRGQALFGDGRTADAIAAYETSLQLDNNASNWVATSAISDAIMMTLAFRGRLQDARVKLDQIISVVLGRGQKRNASNLRLARLGIIYEQNDLITMGSELSELQTIVRYDGGIATGRYQFLSAKYFTAVGEHEKALSTLLQMEKDLTSWTTPDELARALASIMRIYLRLGDKQKPLAWLKSITIDQNSLTILRLSEYLAFADIVRFSDSLEAQQHGLELLDLVHALGDDIGMHGFKVEAYCLQTLLMVVTGDTEGAFVPLQHALALAEPERYIRTFVDFDLPMAALLQEAVIRNIYADYAGFLLNQFSNEPETQEAEIGQQLIDDPLSDRELEVLSLIATHLTGPEIADQLHISLNTFKTHTRNIYSKLGVRRRNAAVTRAQKLGLLK